MSNDNPSQTPTTGRSSNKTRARNVDAISFDQIDNTPAKQLKNIKTEKQSS